MRKLTILSYIIGVVQLVLGLFYLFMPLQFLEIMGHSVPQPDIAYPLGMLSARFLAYGVGMLVIAQEPQKNRLWFIIMILIQVIDLMVGLIYTVTDVVPISVSGFPMFNAALFSLLLWLWLPSTKEQPMHG